MPRGKSRELEIVPRTAKWTVTSAGKRQRICAQTGFLEWTISALPGRTLTLITLSILFPALVTKVLREGTCKNVSECQKQRKKFGSKTNHLKSDSSANAEDTYVDHLAAMALITSVLPLKSLLKSTLERSESTSSSPLRGESGS